MANDDFSLSGEFKASFVNDIVNGMAYLHDTAHIFHGQLDLHSCIVTPQWTVRLSNYGLANTVHDGNKSKLFEVPKKNTHGIVLFIAMMLLLQNFCILRRSCCPDQLLHRMQETCIR